MRHEYVAALPSSLICRRWTKDAKSISLPQSDAEANSRKVFMLRCGALGSSNTKLICLAAQSQENYNEMWNELRRLRTKFEKRCGYKGNENGEKQDKVNDPEIVKTKGAPRKKKGKTRKAHECSRCHTRGHNKKKCPLNPKNKTKRVAATLDSSSDSDDADPNERTRTREIVSFTIFPLYIVLYKF